TTHLAETGGHPPRPVRAATNTQEPRIDRRARQRTGGEQGGAPGPPAAIKKRGMGDGRWGMEAGRPARFVIASLPGRFSARRAVSPGWSLARRDPQLRRDSGTPTGQQSQLESELQPKRPAPSKDGSKTLWSTPSCDLRQC